MNPDILDTLVVVFKGDATHYKKTLQDIISETQKASQQIKSILTSAATSSAPSAATPNTPGVPAAINAGAASGNSIAAKIIRDNETALERYNRMVAAATDLFNKGEISLETYNRELLRQKQILDIAGPDVNANAAKSIRTMQEQIAEASRRAEESLQVSDRKIDSVVRMTKTQSEALQTMRATATALADQIRVLESAAAAETTEEGIRAIRTEVRLLEKELQNVNGQISQTVSNINRNTAAMLAFGHSMTIYGTILAGYGSAMMGWSRNVGMLGVSLSRAGSDAVEVKNKFDAVFAGVNDQAESMAQTLQDSYGLSRSSAKELMSATGDLLVGFGFARSQAAELSFEIQKLAVDLVSFTNHAPGVQHASEAITKALIGETEQIKSLGKAILQKDVNERVAINTARGLIFETERQAKAYATFQLIQEQSVNAIGDYARTNQELAAQFRLLDEEVRNLTESFGEALIPTVSQGIGVFREIIAYFDQLSPATKRMIAVVAASSAVFVGLAGAAVWVVGTLTKLVGMIVLTGSHMITLAGQSVAFLARAFSGVSVSALTLTRVLAGLRAVLTFLTGPLGVIISLLSVLMTLRMSVGWATGFNAAIEKSRQLSEQLQDVIRNKRQADLAFSQGLQGTENKKSYLEKLLEKEQQTLAAQRAELKSWKEHRDQLMSGLLLGENTPFVRMPIEWEYQENVKDTQGRIDETVKQINAIKTALDSLRSADRDKAAVEIESLLEGWAYDTSTLGMDQWEKDIEKIKDKYKDILTEEDLNRLREGAQAAREAAKAFEIAEAVKKANEQTYLIDATSWYMRQGKSEDVARIYAEEDQMLANGVKAEDAAKLREAKLKELEAQGSLSAERLVQDWQSQAETIGMTSREIEIYNLKLKGIDTTRLEELNRLLSREELRQKVIELNKSLEEQIATFGMSSEEAQIYRLRMEGATETELRHARALAAKLKELNEQQKLEEKANSLMEKHKSPAQKLAEAQADLDKMLKANKITLEVYNAELKELHEQMNKDFQMKFGVEGLESMKAGTQEATLALMKWYAAFQKRNFAVQPTDVPKPETPPDPMGNPSAPGPLVAGGAPLMGTSLASQFGVTGDGSQVIEFLRTIADNTRVLANRDPFSFEVANV